MGHSRWCRGLATLPRLMMKITGQHPAEDLLLSASMPQSTDLRQIGLVDDIVEKPEETEGTLGEMTFQRGGNFEVQENCWMKQREEGDFG